MAILAKNPGMNSDNSALDNGSSSHGHDLFLDRQLQNKLLQVDEDCDTEAYESILAKPGNNVKQTNSKTVKIDTHAEDITGWFPNSKFVARRNEGAKNDNQNARPARDTFIHPWKDYRAKKDDNFVFKHYDEPKRYIEQYRKEHGCQINRFSSGNQIGEMRRVAFQHYDEPKRYIEQYRKEHGCQINRFSSGNQIGEMRRVAFQHYDEPKRYIEQYRKEHGCQINRFSSGNQIGEMRRVAFQTSTPTQPQSQNAVQVSLQHLQQSPSGLHYTNRKEQLGTLQVNQGSPAVCTCKPGQLDSSNHNHRYKLSQPVGHMSRTNTTTDIRSHHSELSDNSSESGDGVRSRSRTPIRRINSATSSRSNQRPAKSPTKISVPANSRAYPLHALTIQQNTKQENQPQTPKPLDNLNCVAPEKQPVTTEKKSIEPLDVSLRVQSLHDMLTNSDTPLRGYALPKSTPPNPVSNNEIKDPTSSDSDTNTNTVAPTPDVSFDQISTCALHANKGSNGTQNSTDILQMFLQDPILSRLNQKPPIKEQFIQDNKQSTALGTPKLFSPDAFLIPQNDVDAMLKVNMWNPIISQTPVALKREGSSVAAQPYRTVMTQVPFKNHLLQTQEVKPLKVHQMENIGGPAIADRHDYFNPLKNIKLSITRVNNGVSFCRTQFQEDQETSRKGLNSRGATTVGSLHVKSASGTEMRKSNKDYHQHFVEMNEQKYSRMKMQLKEQGQTAVKKQKGAKVDQKLNLPLPMVKIFESVPTSAFIPSPMLSKSASDLQIMDSRSKSSNEQFRPVYGSARATGRNSVHVEGTNGITTSSIVKKVVPHLGEGTEKVVPDISENFDRDLTDNTIEVKPADAINSEDTTKVKVNNSENTGTESAQHDVDRLNGIIKMFQTNRSQLEDSMKNNNIAVTKDEEKAKVKRENHVDKNNTTTKAPKVAKKPAVASGKLMHQDPQLDGLTWAEKLEILRAVNKRPAKPKPKQPKLRYVTDATDDKIWSPEEEQLYEQRRIKHLLDQSRVKSGKQFDWVHEAQMRARGVDWGTGKLKMMACDMGTDNSDQILTHEKRISKFVNNSDEIPYTEEKHFSKYGINAPTHLSAPHLFEFQDGARSKTFLLP